MESYGLLDGRKISLDELSPTDKAFLHDLARMAKRDVGYFEIYQKAIGPGSPALCGRSAINRRITESAIYQVARDIATRAGIEQGLILAPEYEHLRSKFPADGSHISVTQAADFIGISRAAAYKAIKTRNLIALKIGNVTVVNKQSVIDYRDKRDKSGAPPIEKREKNEYPQFRTLGA